MDQNLRAKASDPSTEAVELQRLAGEYPALRPLIAMNPSTYPALLDWLANLGDPAVNVALQQRHAAEQAEVAATSGAVTQRVSVLSKNGSGQVPPAAPAYVPSNPSAPQTIENDQDPEPSRLRFLWIALGVLLLVAAGILIYNIIGKDSPQQSSAPEVTQSEVASPEAPESNQPQSVEPPADLTIKYPAPTSAIQAQQIQLPSGNIVCTLGDKGATCTIKVHELQGDPVATCVGQPVTLDTATVPAEVGCLVPPVTVDAATELAYGDYATFGRGVCHSTEYGISCWDTITGSSFAVARAGYVVSEYGEIRQSDFPWQ